MTGPDRATERWVDLGDGYAWHTESSLEGVTLCGRTFTEDDVVARDSWERIQQAFHVGDVDPKVCFDCHSVGTGGSIGERRREIHF